MILGALWCICYSMVGVARSENVKNYVNRNLYDEEAEKKLKKIKEISDKNTNKQDFLEKSCVICLENFSEEILEKLMAEKKCNPIEEKDFFEFEEFNNKSPEAKKIEFLPSPRDSNTILSVMENHNNHTNILQDEKICKNNPPNQDIQKLPMENPALNKVDLPEVAKLDCGHVFHSPCIAKWHEKQNKCIYKI
jgi:hypothetical protein